MFRNVYSHLMVPICGQNDDYYIWISVSYDLLLPLSLGKDFSILNWTDTTENSSKNTNHCIGEDELLGSCLVLLMENIREHLSHKCLFYSTKSLPLVRFSLFQYIYYSFEAINLHFYQLFDESILEKKKKNMALRI